jgi:hypothetical protein
MKVCELRLQKITALLTSALVLGVAIPTVQASNNPAPCLIYKGGHVSPQNGVSLDYCVDRGSLGWCSVPAWNYGKIKSATWLCNFDRSGTLMGNCLYSCDEEPFGCCWTASAASPCPTASCP